MKGRNERKKGTKGLQERRQRKNEKLEGKDVVKGRKEGGFCAFFFLGEGGGGEGRCNLHIWRP